MAKLNILLLGLMSAFLINIVVGDNDRVRNARVDRLRRRFQRQIHTNEESRRSTRRHRHEIMTAETSTPAADIASLPQLSQIPDERWKTLRDGSQIYLGEGRSALIVRRRQKVHTRNRGAMKNKTKNGGKKASLSQEQWRGRVRFVVLLFLILCL